MKRVSIDINQLGLVVKKNRYIRVVPAGKYWLGFGEKLELYDLSKPFPGSLDVDVLMQLAGFSEHVELVEVSDNEICLVFVNNNYKQVLAADRKSVV